MSRHSLVPHIKRRRKVRTRTTYLSGWLQIENWVQKI